MIGLVLCGGQSSRMGEDKGLLKIGDITWAEKASSRLSPFTDKVFFSLNNSQLPVYQRTLGERDFLIDNPEVSVKGPLLGLLSAHLAFSKDDFLVLACDMPDMDEKVIRKIKEAALKIKDSVICFRHPPGEIEPLVAFYPCSELNKIRNLLKKGVLEKFSMRYVLSLLSVYYLEIPKTWESYFKNFNSHEDIRQ